MADEIIAIVAFVIWVYLLVARGGFWLCRERDDITPVPPANWPRVTAVIPARNEADCIAQSIGSLVQQDYPGDFSIVLVDDDSRDDTAAIARRTAAALDVRRSISVVTGRELAPGWTGKLWALRQGIDVATTVSHPPDYLLLTDADIVHESNSVSALVVRAERGSFVFVSLMAKLRCKSFAECSHIPAFVFFFQMLFPFSWVNEAGRKTAAAAGGCILVREDALRKAGGVESIRGALIDDCSLARRLKSVGPIWIGLTNRVHSIRRYDSLQDVKHMISRSAYAQLNYSSLLLAGTTIGMALTFLAGPVLAMFGEGMPRLLGAIVWVFMLLAFQPMLRFYQVPLWWGAALPAIATAYMVYTLESAYRYACGQGGSWKGRTQANVSCPPQ
jgi:hopene-associated glycosyltransferase HpnB